MKVNGFEDYKLTRLNPALFCSKKLYSFHYDMFYSKSITHLYKTDYYPILDTLTDYNYKRTISEYFHNRIYSFHKGDSLYFHKGCKIPRVRGDGHWKRVVKVDKANAVVLPAFRGLKYLRDVALFKNDKTIIFMHQSGSKHDFDIGISLYDLCKLHKDILPPDFFINHRDDIDELGDATCIYKGDMLACNEADSCILSLLDETYNEFIFEDDLIRSISDETRQFSMEMIDSIITMLNSNDAESVHAGMRLLASMDYAHYPTVTRYILNATRNNWDKHTPFNSAVKFMMNIVDHKYWLSAFREVLPNEFPLVKELYTELLKDEISEKLQSLNANTNMNVDINFDTIITLTTSDGTVLGTQVEDTEIEEAEIEEAEIEEEQIDEEEEAEDIESDCLDAPGMQLELAFLLKHLYMCNLFCNFKKPK